MSYIESKKINGKVYNYLRKSVRVGRKIKKITIKYLGPIKPVYKKRKDDRKK